MMEEQFMWRAIDLANRAEAQSVSPNPKVGAVLVYQGQIIGEGYHKKVGQAHAEVQCLESVLPHLQHLIPKSTLYVTLEPCAHEGHTPSCAKRLVKERIKEVVIGTLDPNPLTYGKGVDILKTGGIEVHFGLLEQECQEVAKVFFTNQLLHRPFITLKWAESSDGYLDHFRSTDQPNASKLSSSFTQLLTHHLRSQQSAILVGRHTFELDHPQLNNRLWVPSPHSPQPLLLSTQKLNLPPNWYQIQEITPKLLRQLLTEKGITSLLVEGGTLTLQTFISTGLWDEIRQEVSPQKLFTGITSPSLPYNAEAKKVYQFPSGHILTYYQKSKQTNRLTD